MCGAAQLIASMTLPFCPNTRSDILGTTEKMEAWIVAVAPLQSSAISINQQQKHQKAGQVVVVVLAQTSRIATKKDRRNNRRIRLLPGEGELSFGGLIDVSRRQLGVGRQNLVGFLFD